MSDYEQIVNKKLGQVQARTCNLLDP